jgi:hypothetical protein
VRSVLVVCGLAVALVAGCAKRVETEVERPQSTYYPLAVGNSWTYKVRFLGEERQQKVEILRSEDGYFVDTQGGKLVEDAYGVRDQKRYLLRYPLEPGKTWTNVVSVSSVEHYKILETGSRCRVPAGDFQGCVRVESRNRVDAKTVLVGLFTFAPEVGMVHIEVVAEIGQQRIPQTEMSLVSYKLAGKPQPAAVR